YAGFQWAHMNKEEDVILPLAEKALLPSDWAEIDAAFSSNADPMVGVSTQREFRELFRRVVNLMPAPMGLGPEQR
ncbi:MAG: hemerythrin domain-containing protein, partial [Candidatus Competibacteraceae bacterium]|nr:hemerythrin domain-containing protein [Candidatus Competibacteraceae bacterium]